MNEPSRSQAPEPLPTDSTSPVTATFHLVIRGRNIALDWQILLKVIVSGAAIATALLHLLS